MPESEPRNPPKNPTRRYRIAGSGLVCLLLLLGWMRWTQLLNEDERKILGRWTNESVFDDESISISVWRFGSDRSMVLQDTFVIAETEDEKIRQRVTMEEATWRIKNGKIVITPKRSAKTRLRMSFLKLMNTVSKRKFIDNAIGRGRINFPEPDEMTIQWHDSITNKYYDEAAQMRYSWTRVK